MFGRSLSPRIAAVVFFALLALCLAALVAFVWAQQARIISTDARNDHLLKVIDERDGAYNDLLDKYTILSGDCAVAADCNTVTPDPSDIPRAEPGKNGANGRDGRDATDTQVFDQVSRYCALNGVCAGKNGKDGQNGADGAPGASIPGKDGTNGTNGRDGVDGAPGAAGQPPLSWKYTTATGRQVLCSRDTPFDPTAPTYMCATITPTGE